MSKPATRTIKTEDMHVPLIVHTVLPGLPLEKTLAAEKEIAEDKRLFHHIAVLSDANKKKRVLHPASSIASSQTHIMPQLFDAAPNCGMRLIATDLTDDDVTSAKLDHLFKDLLRVIPTKKYVGTPLPLRVIVDSFLHGSKPVADYLKVRTVDEIAHTADQGNSFSVVPEKYRLHNKAELYKVIPPNLVKLARFRLGILGATRSHFLSLMKVDDILEPKAAAKLGLHRGQYVFYMHTGSGIIGRYIGYLYSAQARKYTHSLHLAIGKLGFRSSVYTKVNKLVQSAIQDKSILGFKADSPEGWMCVQAMQAAGNQGFANRTVLTHNLDQALERSLGRQINLRLIYDAPHVVLSCEQQYGETVWVHRNGATRTSLGEPGLLAPFEQTFGYIGIGTDKNSTTFTSANHELGKLDNTPEETFEALPKHAQAKFSPVSVYTKEETQTVIPQPLHATFGQTIAEEIEQNNILLLVAKLKTLASLTHHS